LWYPPRHCADLWPFINRFYLENKSSSQSSVFFFGFYCFVDSGQWWGCTSMVSRTKWLCFMWLRQRQWNTYSALPIQQRSLVQTSQDGSFKYYQQIPASLINSERNTVCLVPFGSHDLKNVFSTLYIFLVLEVIILNYSFICRKIPGYKLSLTKFL